MRSSFIITTYNHEKYIHECLLSIFDQTTPPDEVIISDDASTDDTWQIIIETVNSYEDGNYKCVLNRNIKNIGVANNFATALEKASGDILIFGAGDDVYTKNKVSTTLNYYRENPKIAGMFTNLMVIDRNSNRVRPFFEIKPKIVEGRQDLVFLRPPWCIGASQSARKEVIDNYAKTPFISIATDGVMAFRSALEGGFGYLDEITVFYRIHGENLSQQLEAEAKIDFVVSKALFYKELCQNSLQRRVYSVLPALVLRYVAFLIFGFSVKVRIIRLLLLRFLNEKSKK